MINRKRAAYIVAACVVVFVCVGLFWSSKAFGLFGDEVSIDPSRYYPVSHVVDGDTFKVDLDEPTGKNIITVRVLGINTPETVDPRKGVECYGPEASAEAKRLLGGHKVRLSFSPNRELKDKYGRYLAYVYIDDDGQSFYNKLMLKNGYAKEYTFGTAYSMQREFRATEAEAKKKGVGLWTACMKNTK